MTKAKGKKRVSLKKAVAALETLVEELNALPAASDADDPDARVIDGMRKQVEGMALTMRGACEGRGGQDDFSFPGA